MIENNSKKSYGKRMTKYKVVIYITLFIIGCCSIWVAFYLWLNFEYIRANFIAAIAQGRVEQIYTQIHEIVPSGVTLIKEEKPQSDTYTWGLSDESPRYARVRAQQIYRASIAFDDILITYKTTFKQLGWITFTLNNETDLLSFVFRHPSDFNLLVGLCSPIRSARRTVSVQYIVFFDFDEATGCEETRLDCIVRRYCE